LYKELGEAILFVRQSSEAPAAPPRNFLGGTEQKFPFPFLNFFQGGAQKKNCKGKFLRGCRRSVSGGGRRGGASEFAVRIFVKKSSDFNQKAPLI